jgi:hypothetical protein
MQRQISQVLKTAPPPMNAMAELARQNMELWTRMQESMLGLIGGKRATGSQGAPREPPPEDKTSGEEAGSGPRADTD